MKVEDIERAVSLKKELDKVGERLKHLHELGRVGVSSVQLMSGADSDDRLWLEETCFGTDLMLDMVQLFVRHQEAKYNEIAHEIAAL